MPGVERSPLGEIGRVTGEICPGHTGEVTVAIRGGSEVFSAFAIDPEETIPVRTRITVQEFQPPRTVFVARLD